MAFKPGDIPYFSNYEFTDNGDVRPHFGLVLLPENATKYQNSVLCCVITSSQPRSLKLSLGLDHNKYTCFDRISYACFNRKDLVSKNGLANEPQPKGSLDPDDFRAAFKKLKKSIFAIQDLVSNDTFLRAVVISEWK